ncbi:MAG: DNA primase [Candidatus Omnitrophota bacterium]|nr:DNA primase [Candidatus Omnitrophota bacterium]
MAGLIPEDIINQVLDRVDIVEIISSYLPLKRAGRNFKALCPFHHEKTASFTVNPDKQIYHCFGCGVGGNVFNFVMRQERMEFPEAVEMLAKKLGINLPKPEFKNQHTLNLNQQLYKLNELACDFYHQTLCELPQGKIAFVYLEKRKVDLATIKRFKLGFAPDKWDGLLNFIRGKGIGLSLLEKSGLIIAKENKDGFYDRFRNRVSFPIFDIKSRIIGFGARLLESSESAKYINSPETPIYIKGNNLYGLNFSKDAIRDKDFAIIVEGYLDFITPFKAGIENIVASLGTALTEEQIRILKRYTHNCIMLFDADSAGELATLRSLDILLEEGMNVKVATLPSGFDPDSFVNKFGAEPFKEIIKQAKALFEYKLDLCLNKFNCKEVEGKSRIAGEMLPTVNKFPNAVLRFGYLKKLSEVLSVDEQALLIELKKLKQSNPYFSSKDKETSFKKLSATSSVEKMILKLLLAENKFIEQFKDNLDISDFEDSCMKEIITAILDFVSQGKEVTAHKLINRLESRIAHETISELCTQDDLLVVDKEKVFKECLERLKKERLKARCKQLQQEIHLAEASGNNEKAYKLFTEYNQLIKG